MDEMLQQFIHRLNGRDARSGPAAREIGRSDDPKAEAALIDFLKDEEETDALIDDAAESLAEIWNRNKSWNKEILFSLPKKARYFLSRRIKKAKDETLQYYICLLNDRDAWYSDEAAWEIAQFNDPEAEEALVDFLKEEDETDSLIDHAAESLAEIWNRNKSWNKETCTSLPEKARYFLSLYLQKSKPEWFEGN